LGAMRGSARAKARYPGRKRRSGRRSLWFLKVLLTGALLSGIGFLGYMAYERFIASDIFKLEKIFVEGNLYTERERVISLSGIKIGANVFSVDLRSAAERVASDPMIRDAVVSRRLPNAILISIEEREPIALVSMDRIYAVDGEGVLLPPIPPEKMPSLPVFTWDGGKWPPFKVGEPIRSAALERAIELLNSVREVDPLFVLEISEVKLSEGSLPVLYLMEDGVEVRWGEWDVTEQIASLRAVMRELSSSSRSAVYVDLRFEGQVVVMPEG